MISVCVATYNGEKYIKEQIDSILCQLGPDDEIVISDDQSKDQTIEILKSYKDSRIKIFTHSSEGRNSFEKVTNNFENAIGHAKGDYIFLSDQDDEWHHNKVEVLCKSLKHNLLVQSAFSCKWEDGAQIDTSFKKRPYKKTWLGNLWDLPFMGCCMAFRKELKDIIIPFPKGIDAHDAWIGMVAYSTNRISFIDEPLFDYRIHASNVAGNNASSNSFIRKIKYRFVIASHILKRYEALKTIKNNRQCLE